MTVQLAANGNVELKGSCPVEDAEELLKHLLAKPNAAITWDECEWAHTAVIQVLLVAKSVPVGIPTGSFLRDYVGPLLRRAAF
jgi:hypothetical protein